MANWSSTLDKGRRDKRRSRGCPAGSRWRRAGTLGACALGVFMVAACDSLLEVELPGQLRAADLDNPRLAELLARSVQGDFDCALSTYVWAGGLWANDLYQTNNSSRSRLTQLRSDEVLIFEQNECDELEFPQLYLPFQIVRFQGEEAVRLIEGFPDGEIEDKDFLLGIAHAYTGYAYEILGETMCSLAFDGGPLVTRESAMELAKLRFTSAIKHASLVTSGSNAAEALDIVNMSYVGRARASLNLGDVPGVLADAGAVDPGFVRFAEMNESDERRWNQVYNRNERSGGDSVIHPSYGNLMVGGVPDPRVETEIDPGNIPFDKVSEVWYQFKYPSLEHRHSIFLLARGPAHDRGGGSGAIRGHHQQPPSGPSWGWPRTPAGLRTQSSRHWCGRSGGESSSCKVPRSETCCGSTSPQSLRMTSRLV